MTQFNEPVSSASTSKFFVMRGLGAALLGNVLVLLLVFSVWLEQGPYHWIAAAQYRIFEGYSQKLTLFFTVCIFTIAALSLMKPILRGGKWALALACWPSLLLVVIHFLLSLYFVISGGARQREASLEDAVNVANFFPTAVLFDQREFAGLDYTKTTHIARETSNRGNRSPKTNGMYYTPIAKVSGGDFSLPVVMAAKGWMLDEMKAEREVEGLIYRAPFPFLVRDAWQERKADHGVIFRKGETVRGYWSVFVFMHGLLIACLLWALWSKRKKASSAVVGNFRSVE